MNRDEPRKKSYISRCKNFTVAWYISCWSAARITRSAEVIKREISGPRVCRVEEIRECATHRRESRAPSRMRELVGRLRSELLRRRSVALGSIRTRPPTPATRSTRRSVGRLYATREGREKPRGAARIRERHGRACDEDTKELAIERLDKNYRNAAFIARRRGSGGFSIVVVVVVDTTAQRQSWSLLSIESAERSILAREDDSCQKCGAASDRDMVYGGGFDMVETVSFDDFDSHYFSILCDFYINFLLCRFFFERMCYFMWKPV